MSEKEEVEMVIPRSWNYVHRKPNDFLDFIDDGNTSKKFYTRLIHDHTYSKKVVYLMRDEVAVERCEYRENGAVCYQGKTDNRLRSIKTDFIICQALYTLMEDASVVKDYLILVGEDQIMFWQVENGDCSVISVSFRIERAFSSELGIIVERTRVHEEENSAMDICHIFSILNPFAEITPLLFKDSHGSYSQYAFSKRKITLIPSNFQNSGKYFLGFDQTADRHMLFILRKSTDSEKSEAAKMLSTSYLSFSESFSFHTVKRNSFLRSSYGPGSSKVTPTSSILRQRDPDRTPTGVRRSLRNRGRQVSKTGTPLMDQNETVASSMISFRTDAGNLTRRRPVNTFRVFDLNGEETDEIFVEYTLETVWTEITDDDKLQCSFKNSTPRQISTPKSIMLQRNADGTPLSTKETTPNRSVKFVQNDEKEEDSDIAYDSGLFRKNDFKSVPFNDELSSINSSRRSIIVHLESEDPFFYFKNVQNYSNEELLKILDELLSRQRDRILQDSLPAIDLEQMLKEIDVGASNVSDYIEAKNGVMKYYTNLMQEKLGNGDEEVKAYYALLLYRKELYQIYENDRKSNAAITLNTRIATRFYVTKDMNGQKFFCFLPGNESTLKMIKWDSQNDSYVSTASIPASDAINIPGSNMMAVLRHSTVSLYTGHHEIGPLFMKRFRQSSHQILQLIESHEKSIIVKLQRKHRLAVQCMLFDLSSPFSEKINNFFESIFQTLPMEKAVKFYSSWHSINLLGNLDNSKLQKKSLLLELSFLVENFFFAMGLEVSGLKCMQVIRKARECENVETSAKKLRNVAVDCSSDSDSSDEDSKQQDENAIMEVMKEDEKKKNIHDFDDFSTIEQEETKEDSRKVVISEAEGKRNYLGKNAFDLFCVLHQTFESLQNDHSRQKISLLLIEPLFVFAKIFNLKKYVQYYISADSKLSAMEIEMNQNIVLSEIEASPDTEPIKVSQIDILADIEKNLEGGLSRRRLRAIPTNHEQELWTHLQWPTDIRHTNAVQMLDSSKQMLIPIRRTEDETVNHEASSIFLVGALNKQVSKAFGRAALSFLSNRMSKIETTPPDKVELSGRTPVNHQHKEFPQSEIGKATFEWSDFMAGASATLSLTDQESVPFSWLRQWHSCFRSGQGALSAGSLFAYGILGQFKHVHIHDIHSMLFKFKKTYESISLLLGAAISYRKTSNLLFYRTISTHIPSFIEPTLVELKFEAVVQTASILGVGLLFQETLNGSIANRIINEMAKETFFEGESESYRYGYVLSCAIAVGLINLARGVDLRNAEKPAVDNNFEIEERLIILLEGGERIACTDFGRRNASLCRVQRIGAAALGSVALPPSANSCTTIDFAAVHGIGINPEPNGMTTAHNEVNRHTANSVNGTLTKESSTSRELSTVNIHLTSPAAALALALMYLKTGDKFISQKLAVPKTLPEIEKIRPDVLMLRSLCSLMVDYDNIRPDVDFVNSLIPEVITRYSTSADGNIENQWWSPYIDMNTVAESYYYIKCGICLAIGIRFASTFNAEAAETLHKFFDECSPQGKNYFIPKLRKYLKQSVSNSCAAVTAYALSLVMAGSGDLEAMKVIRTIRNYLPENFASETDIFTYSVQAYCNTALGFLFLGNARYGFSQSTEAVAMLLISSYPIMPQSICDQRHYFQPMRFFWALATEFRHLVPVDDCSFQPVRMQAKITIKGNTKPLILQLPAVLPPLEIIEKIAIYSRDYKEVILDMSIKEDVAQLQKALKEYHGRFTMKKVLKPYAKVFDTLPVYRKSDMDDCEPAFEV